jgi:hypothetical protein
LFGRIEYEFLGHRGPPRSVPGFKGLFSVQIGGANRVINGINTLLFLDRELDLRQWPPDRLQ